LNTRYKLDPDLRFTWMARGERKLEPMPFKCWMPLESVNIDKHGRVFVCDCDGQLPWPVGHVLDFETLQEVWESPVAQKLQANTQEGTTFKFCDTINCGIKKEKRYAKAWLSIGIDESCNLQCASCREERIYHKEGTPQYSVTKVYMDRISKWIENYQNPLIINIGTNGDALASPIYSKFLYSHVLKDTHEFRIQTNGLMLDRFKGTKFDNGRSTLVYLSLDAGDKETYEIVRFPGKWEKVISNIDYLSDRNFHVLLTFVVQRSNINSALKFAELCKKYRMPGIFIGLQNWGTWHDFGAHAVSKEEWEPIKKQCAEIWERLTFKGC